MKQYIRKVGELVGPKYTQNKRVMNLADRCRSPWRSCGDWDGIVMGSQEPRMQENDVLTIAEAAELLRVHPKTLRKRAAAWGVPHRRLGAEWRFSRATLTAWIQQREAA